MKSLKVITLDAAYQDMLRGQEFYEEQEEGIGFYFFECLLSDIDSLEQLAGIHQTHFGFYRMLAKKFPFAIYYDMKEDFVRVAAVLDMRMNPLWIREELALRTTAR